MSNPEQATTESRRLITIPTIQSIARPILVGMGIWHLSHGRPVRAAAEVTAAAFTDWSDGKSARWIEARWPGWGVTVPGAKADQGADTFGLGIGGIGLVVSSKVHPIARVSTVVVLGHEAWKTRRAKRMMDDYQIRTATKGIPAIPSSAIGKKSITLKGAAEAGAAFTALPALIKRPWLRTTMAVGTLVAAGYGAKYGEDAGQGYEKYYADVLVPTLPELEPPTSEILQTVSTPPIA